MGPPSLGDVVPKCGDLNLLIGIPRVREGDWAPLHQPLAKLISFVAVFREGMFIRFIEQHPSRRWHARAWAAGHRLRLFVERALQDM